MYMSIILVTMVLVLLTLFVIRLARIMRRTIRDEQILVAILLFVTFLYSDIIEKSIDETHVIE